MDPWILGYLKSVKDSAPSVSAEAWAMHELEAPEPPPAELRALYSAFDGGRLEGNVRLYRFAQVLEHRNGDELPAWIFGEKGDLRMMAARKATLAAQPGLQLRPSWFEATGADALVFARRDTRSAAVRVYPSLEQLLAVMVPPAQLEAFGENTYARAMAAVEDALGNVTASDSRVLALKSPSKKKQKQKVVVLKKKSKSPTPTKRKKSMAAKKKSVKKPAKKAAAKKPVAKKAAAKKPVAKKAAAKKPAAKKAAAKKPAAKKPAAKKAAAKKPAAKPAAKKPAAKPAPRAKPVAAAPAPVAPAPAPAPVAAPTAITPAANPM